ncbi:MAG TPA: MarR family transcriptional regulator [Solirubrobacterales bacterium]
MSELATSAAAEARDRTAVGLAFRRAYHSLRRLRARDANAVEGEPGNAHYELLARLDEEGPLAAGALAERLHVTPATISQMVDALAEAGFVERRRSEQDRRVVLVELTDRGRPWITTCRGAWQHRWRAALAGFDDRELQIAADVLDRIADMVDEVYEEGKVQAEPGPGSNARK